ncbi:MAG: DUF924 family protein [Polaromonas sp.]
MTQPTFPQQTLLTAEILDFWLADGLALGWPTQNLHARWFRGGATLDQEIKTRFGPAVRLAVQGGLQDWENQVMSRLALVIVLDQFTRNVFRGTGAAFDGDVRAQQLTLQTLAQHEDLQLPWVGRVFLYMPLMHAEDAALQAKSVACFSQLMTDAPAALKTRLQSHLDFAHQHQDLIARFGRFPYRNAALERSSTAAEKEFLLTARRYGQ